MKKIFVLLFSIILLFSSLLYTTNASTGKCSPISLSGSVDIKKSLDNCLSDSSLVNGTNTKIIGEGGGFGVQLKKWVNNIAIFLGVLTVGSIVLGAFMLTISAGEDEKLKKAKDIVKWGIIGFLGLIFASAIVNLIIKIMYSI